MPRAEKYHVRGRMTALIALASLLALSTGCLKDAKVAGHDQEARTDQGGPSGPVGGDSWVFNFSRT